MSWFHRHRLELVARTYAAPVPDGARVEGFAGVEAFERMVHGCTSYVYRCADPACSFSKVVVALGKEITTIKHELAELEGGGQ